MSYSMTSYIHNCLFQLVACSKLCHTPILLGYITAYIISFTTISSGLIYHQNLYLFNCCQRYIVIVFFRPLHGIVTVILLILYTWSGSYCMFLINLLTCKLSTWFFFWNFPHTSQSGMESVIETNTLLRY